MGPTPSTQQDTLEQLLGLEEPLRPQEWRDPHTCGIFGHYEGTTKRRV